MIFSTQTHFVALNQWMQKVIMGDSKTVLIISFFASDEVATNLSRLVKNFIEFFSQDKSVIMCVCPKGDPKMPLALEDVLKNTCLPKVDFLLVVNAGEEEVILINELLSYCLPENTFFIE